VQVLALRIDLRFPASQSLKEKRMALKPIVEGLRARFRLSVAETAHHDSWQRAEVGVALVSGDVHTIEKLADDVERFVWQAADAEVLEIDRTWLPLDL
jgi:uncharacterized protein YlxP (DUF503 family)